MDGAERGVGLERPQAILESIADALSPLVSYFATDDVQVLSDAGAQVGGVSG